MTFEKEYFLGEERDGFYIQPIMKRTWAAQLEVLKEIDRICKRHDIKYFAYSGTLLGAVRHQGFIPWDDDMDLGMLRGDYEKFLELIRTELPKGWCVLNTQPTMIRVMNSDTVREDQEFLEKFHGCPYIVGVDIFCWDSVPCDEKVKKAVMDIFWSIAYLAVYWDECAENEQQAWREARESGARNIERITGYHFDWNDSMKEQLSYLADRVIALYWDETCEEVSRFFLLHERSDFHIASSCFDKMIEVPYENTTIPIPEKYDMLLRLLYGDDYMTPLKADFHSYPFFRNQVSILRDRYEAQGKQLPECFEWKETIGAETGERDGTIL